MISSTAVDIYILTVEFLSVCVRYLEFYLDNIRPQWKCLRDIDSLNIVSQLIDSEMRAECMIRIYFHTLGLEGVEVSLARFVVCFRFLIFEVILSRKAIHENNCWFYSHDWSDPSSRDFHHLKGLYNEDVNARKRSAASYVRKFDLTSLSLRNFEVLEFQS
jgi:hypothetical protein